MLLISTLFINNVFTTMTTTFIALITSCIWFIITEFHLYFLLNTMFPYFNLYEMIIINKEIYPDNYFIDAIRFVSSNLSKGIIICLITIVIKYNIKILRYTLLYLSIFFNNYHSIYIQYFHLCKI